CARSGPTTSRSSSRRRSCARSPARITISASMNSPTPGAPASSASSPPTRASRIISIFTDARASAKVPVLDVAARYTELGEALLPLINPAVTRMYGLEINSFVVENVSVPPEGEQAIDQTSSMAAIGNLNDYVKYQMGKGFEAGGGGGGAAGTAAEL